MGGTVEELAAHFPPPPLRILDLGCGSGHVHAALRPSPEDYVGVDFSRTMLAAMKADAPDARLLCADVTRLPLARGGFNLVIANGVCQFLTRDQLGRNLDQVRGLMAPEGRYLIANVPDTALRWRHFAGSLGPGRRFSLWTLARNVYSEFIRRRDPIGEWYARDEVAELAARHGFRCETSPSRGYEYRFHAVLRRNGP